MSLQDWFWSVSRVSIMASSFNAIDLKLSALFGMVLLIATVSACYMRRKQRRNFLFSDALLVAGVGQIVLYAVAPWHAAGGGVINYRVFLFALVTLALWISIQQYNKTAIALISSAAAVICVGLVVRNLQRNLWLSAALDEYREVASHIEEGKSLVAFDFDVFPGYGGTRDPGMKYDPFMHAAALVATERNLVDLSNYEAESRNFPIVFRYSLDPMRTVEGKGLFGDIARYERTTGRTIDYVLLWDVKQWDSDSPFGKIARQQVYRDYALIYCAPNIPLELYRVRRQVDSADVAPACPAPGSRKVEAHAAQFGATGRP